MKSRINITILILFHWIVLTAPMLSKSLHHHSHNEHDACNHDGTSIETQTKVCYICDFNYLPFIEPEQSQLSSSSAIFFTFSIPSTPELRVSYHFQQLRAPPVA